MELAEYTEKLTERTKARKEYLSKKVAEAKKRRTVLSDDTEDLHPDFSEENDDSPKRQCLDHVAISGQYNENIQCLKSNYENKENEYDDAEVLPGIAFGARGLAALQKKKSVDKDAVVESNDDNEGSPESKESQGFVKSPSKAKLLFDFSKSTVKTLEPTDEEVDMDCQSEIIKSDASHGSGKTVVTECQPSSPKKLFEVPEHVKATDRIQDSVDLNASFDPAQLPLSARKALFEKAFNGNASKQVESNIEPNLSVAQRAAMFEKASRGSKCISAPKKPSNDLPKSPLAVTSGMKITSPAVAKPKSNSQDSVSTVQISTVDPKFTSPAKHSSPDAVLSPSKNVGNHTRLVHQQLIENSSNDWRKKDIVAKACTERKNEISALLSHWERVSSSSAEAADDSAVEYPKKSTSSESEKYETVFEESECANDDEEVEAEDDEASDGNNSTTESESTQSATESESYISSQEDVRNCNLGSGSISSEAAAVCNEMDSILHDALAQEDEVMPPPEIPSISLPSKHSSNSYKSSSGSSSSSGSASSRSQISDRGYRTPTISGSSEVFNNEEETPLLHTVSFYRRQKREKQVTPVRTIVHHPEASSPPSPEADNSKNVQEKIKALQEEILAQQTVISQTSQALNLCHATEEFFGSMEQVEGERLLLIATQKRVACLNEIQRLKSHGMNDQIDGTGTLILNDIKLPLKREFISAHLNGKSGDTVHYFLCIVRYAHQVIVTQMLSAQDGVKNGSLSFSNHITLHNLPSDFSVAFEVYALQTKKEVLPHDRKYHIRRDHSKIRLTPKGKKSDSKLISPVISSPGGPNAVRTPSFTVVGFTRFSLQNCDRKAYTLEKVPFPSPLEGVLQLNIQLHAEHKIVEKGFLTMFEDVSGFGAWHRRWGVLDGKDMAFWKYPDDEKRKAPMLVIDLKQCITREVKLVPRDVCARPHTFELVTVRPQEKGDKNTLISRSVNTLTTTKYLLSADVKEERIMWCKRLNDALTNTRKWDPNAMRPIDMKHDK